MKKTIILQKSLGKFEDYNPIILSDEKLSFEFDSIYDLSESIITLKNGEESTTMKLTAPFTVPDSVLFSGWLSVGITMYLRGDIVKKWQLLPIKIIESDKTVTPDEQVKAHDLEIKKLKAEKVGVEDKEEILAKIDELKTMLTELAEKHNKLADIVKLIKEV